MIPLSDVERLRAELTAQGVLRQRAPRSDTIAAMVRANAQKDERARVRASVPTDPSREGLRAKVRAVLENGDDVEVGDTWEDPSTGATLSVTREDLDTVTRAINLDEDEADAAEQKLLTEAQAAFARMSAEVEAASERERAERNARAAYENETLDAAQLGRWFAAWRDEQRAAVRDGEIRRVEPPTSARWTGDWRFNRDDAQSLRDRLERLKRGSVAPSADDWTALLRTLLRRAR